MWLSSRTVRDFQTAEGGLGDETWQPPGPAAALRFTSGTPFRFAVPGAGFDSFDGPGGDSVAAGVNAASASFPYATFDYATGCVTFI